MSNRIKQTLNNLEIPEGLHKRSKLGISKAKQEMNKNRRSFFGKGLTVTAIFIVFSGIFIWWNNGNFLNKIISNPDTLTVNKDGSVNIPAIELYVDENSDSDMVGLVVYKGKIYTQAESKIKSKNAEAMKGNKIGTAKGTIDEWSTQKDYDEELASTYGNADVYTVKGYDEDFRIMMIGDWGEELYVEFFENLNGITVNSGEDVFGKLNMMNHATSAEWRSFDDWYYSTNHSQPIADMKVIHTFVEALNQTKPLIIEYDSTSPIQSKNNENYKELIVHLDDGVAVRLSLYKDGYIQYGDMIDVFFKMDDEVFSQLWEQLQ